MVLVLPKLLSRPPNLLSDRAIRIETACRKWIRICKFLDLKDAPASGVVHDIIRLLPTGEGFILPVQTLGAKVPFEQTLRQGLLNIDHLSSL